MCGFFERTRRCIWLVNYYKRNLQWAPSRRTCEIRGYPNTIQWRTKRLMRSCVWVLNVLDSPEFRGCHSKSIRFRHFTFLSTFAIRTSEKKHIKRSERCKDQSWMLVHLRLMCECALDWVQTRMQGEQWKREEREREKIKLQIYSSHWQWCALFSVLWEKVDAFFFAAQWKSNLIDDASISWNCGSNTHSIASPMEIRFTKEKMVRKAFVYLSVW